MASTMQKHVRIYWNGIQTIKCHTIQFENSVISVTYGYRRFYCYCYCFYAVVVGIVVFVDFILIAIVCVCTVHAFLSLKHKIEQKGDN